MHDLSDKPKNGGPEVLSDKYYPDGREQIEETLFGSKPPRIVDLPGLEKEVKNKLLNEGQKEWTLEMWEQAGSASAVNSKDSKGRLPQTKCKVDKLSLTPAGALIIKRSDGEMRTFGVNTEQTLIFDNPAGALTMMWSNNEGETRKMQVLRFSEPRVGDQDIYLKMARVARVISEEGHKNRQHLNGEQVYGVQGDGVKYGMSFDKQGPDKTNLISWGGEVKIEPSQYQMLVDPKYLVGGGQIDSDSCVYFSLAMMSHLCGNARSIGENRTSEYMIGNSEITRGLVKILRKMNGSKPRMSRQEMREMYSRMPDQNTSFEYMSDVIRPGESTNDLVSRLLDESMVCAVEVGGHECVVIGKDPNTGDLIAWDSLLGDKDHGLRKIDHNLGISAVYLGAKVNDYFRLKNQ